MPADGGIRFGQYVLLRRIARGGMAEVFLAQQRGLEGFDRRVAVKRILPHLADSPDFVKMFLGEAKLAAQLTHPNVVHIYDFGKVENDYFIAMEYVEGVHAGQIFKHGERERMSPTLVARIGADAAAALHYAHELRAPNGKALALVHRDVSPANIMVSYDGAVKLCDFGIAKAAAMSDQLTNPGQVKGKYAYMSPEQTIASPLDGRSDVFSLAVVLWELLTAKTIVPRGDAVESMRAIRDGKLPALEKVAPGTPQALVDAINWALETKRERRATAADLAQALEAFIKVSPELATPMQLGAWVRGRFPREVTGSHLAITTSARLSSDASDEHTSGGHGTLAAPGTGEESSDLGDGTHISEGGTMGDPGTSLTQGLGTGDLLSASGPEDGATLIKPAREMPILSELTPAPEGLVTGRITAPRDTLDDNDERETYDDEQARLRDLKNTTLGDTVSRGDGAATTIRESGAHLGGSGPTVRDSGPYPGPRIGDSAPRSAPGATTMVSPVVRPSHQELRDSRPNMFGPTDVIADVAPRPIPRRTKVMAVLGAIALLSFIVALGMATSSTPAVQRPGPPRDAPVAALRPDAALVVAIAPDAPEAPADAQREPTIRTPGLDGGTAVNPSLVTVNTQPPGGTVKIGNEGARRAPAQFALAPGTYEAYAELDGYQPERRPITVFENVDSSFEIAFTRRATTTQSPPIPATPQTGRLTVRTTPYSEVYLGTKLLGTTPFAELEVPVGKLTLLFKHPDHATVRRTVLIEPGETTKLPPFDLP